MAGVRRFELFVAQRYLKSKRKQAVISLITAISIMGVAAGVMALVIALAVNNGFRNTLQRNLLGATAHVTVLEKDPQFGIERWEQLLPKLRAIPHVIGAAPVLYGNVMVSGPARATGAVLKGVDVASELHMSGILRHLREGSVDDLRTTEPLPGVVIGSKLAQSTGAALHSVVTIISPQGELTPFGPKLTPFRFRVVGVFESGFFDLDSSWVFTSLPSAQRALFLSDVVNAIELKLDDIYAAPAVAKAVEGAVGPKLAATHWQEQNRQLLHALRMERAVTVITIGLIQLVAALNILITLVMMVMEKQKDIAILMSLGARREQIRNIFMLQGVIIGVVGAALGLAAGYTLCHFADKYRWIRLDEEVYSLAFVPFEPRWADGIWIAGAAILISFLATIYPARAATRIAPVEALRYE
jgi:lipoprotein-releasing system permease protein